MKSNILKFRTINSDIFQAIIEGKKRFETRAATPKYMKIKAEVISLR